LGLRDIKTRVDDERSIRRMRRQVERVESYLEAPPGPASESPVLFFNASTRIHRLSLNAAFGRLAAWGVRAAGAPVRHVVCEAGLLQCPLGTHRLRLEAGPPCGPCTRFSRTLFQEQGVLPLSPPIETTAVEDLALARMDQMATWQFRGHALGELVLPSLRWVLRRHDLQDTPAVRNLFLRYLASAAHIVLRFETLLTELHPRALVVFNGIMFPEAVARAVFLRAGLPVVTHEVGLQPMSAFFSHGHATFRQVEPEEGRELSAAQTQRLQAYLQDRFNGRFSMAGIRFWPAMRPLPEELRRRLEAEGPAVLVFPNVVFDTSQIHANTLYPSMFAWLEDIRQAMQRHPERLFVLRAHPDENRPGKEAQQSVAQWVAASGVDRLPNVVFLGPSEQVSTYDLFRLAGSVLVYNSSVGLEASVAGLPVLCAGRARYSQAGAAFHPGTRDGYREILEDWLAAGEVRPGQGHADRARRFLDFELFSASLDFSPFLRDRAGYPGMVELLPFDPPEIHRSADLDVIVRGILDGAPFVRPESEPVTLTV